MPTCRGTNAPSPSFPNPGRGERRRLGPRSSPGPLPQTQPPPIPSTLSGPSSSIQLAGALACSPVPARGRNRAALALLPSFPQPGSRAPGGSKKRPGRCCWRIVPKSPGSMPRQTAEPGKGKGIDAEPRRWRKPGRWEEAGRDLEKGSGRRGDGDLGALEN